MSKSCHKPITDEISIVKIIYLYILAECSRVALQYVNGEENSDYINAVFVDVCIGTSDSPPYGAVYPAVRIRDQLIYH